MAHFDETKKDHKLSYPIWEFNYKPENYVHPSWIVDLAHADLLKKLVTENNVNETTQLSYYLMSELGFTNNFHSNFSDPMSRLALWKTRDIKNLIYHLGTLFYFDDIRHKITKSEVNTLKKQLGNTLYEFSLNRAPQLQKQQLKAMGISTELPIRKQILLAGIISFFTEIKKHPSSLSKRMVIKLPRKWFKYYVYYVKKNNITIINKPKNTVIINQMIVELGRKNER